MHELIKAREQEDIELHGVRRRLKTNGETLRNPFLGHIFRFNEACVRICSLHGVNQDIEKNKLFF